MTRRLAVLLATLGCLAAHAVAGERVDQRRPARPDGLVEVDNPAGSIKVTGWDRAEVAVAGTLGNGADGLEFTSEGGRTRISVDTTGDPHRVNSMLEIRVPAGSRLEIETMGAAIEVSDVKGSVHAENVNASISVTGSSGPVEVESVNGAVTVSGPTNHVRAESVNGAVEVRGAGGEVEASTVNGRLVVSGTTFERATLETVNGSLRFEGGLSPRATVNVETVGGEVELVLPANTSADFSVYTFNGEVRNELGTSTLRKSRDGSEKELIFTVGSGGAKVRVQTLNGGIHLRKREGSGASR